MSKSMIVRLFTSESVCAGHPDKVADAISDAIVDAAFAQDIRSHTAIETVAGANQICVWPVMDAVDQIKLFGKHILSK